MSLNGRDLSIKSLSRVVICQSSADTKKPTLFGHGLNNMEAEPWKETLLLLSYVTSRSSIPILARAHIH